MWNKVVNTTHYSYNSSCQKNKDELEVSHFSPVWQEVDYVKQKHELGSKSMVTFSESEL